MLVVFELQLKLLAQKTESLLVLELEYFVIEFA
jgi:hypothetical protein